MPAIDGPGLVEPAYQALQTGTPAEKGQTLERCIMGFVDAFDETRQVETNVRADADDVEVDVAVFHDLSGPLAFLGTVFFVECKNWTGPVGAQEVSWFERKVTDRNLSTGVLVASNGVTGMERQGAALAQITNALARGMHILVVTLDELRAVASTDDLVDLLQRKRLKLHVGKSQI